MDADSEEELEAIRKQLELQLKLVQQKLKQKKQTKGDELRPSTSVVGDACPDSVSINREKQNGEEDPPPRYFKESKKTYSSGHNLKKESSTPSQQFPFPQNRFQTYKKLPGSKDLGREFEQAMCCYYSIKLATDDDVNDFEMTSNDLKDGKFDDIGFKVTFKDGRCKRFLLQLKHKENKKVNLADLKSENKNNDFSVHKYLQSVSEMRLNQETVCILSTNSSTTIKGKVQLTDEITVEQCEQLEPEEFLVNTDKGESNSTFKIRSENSNQQFYFLTSQMNVKRTEGKVNTMLKNLLGCDIWGAFTSYMRHWWAGKFVLTKHDVIAKISQLAFSPFLKTLTDEKSNEKTESLKKAVMNFQLTIIAECDEDLMEHIWKIENTSSDEELSKAKEKYGLKENQVSTTLWFLGKIPLVVKVDNQNERTIRRVMDLLGRDVGDKKIILTGRVPPNEFTQYSKLESLSDIIIKCRNEKYCLDMLQTFHISLQGRKSVTLEDLIKIDEHVSELIGTTELLRMSQGEHLLVGDPNEELPDLHIPRTISSVFIKVKDILDSCEASDDTLIILNVDETSSKDLLENREFNKMELSQYLNTSTNEEQTNLILLSTGNKCTNLQFESICSKSNKSNIHLLQHFDDGYCIPILGKGKKLTLETTNPTEPVREDIILEYYNNPLHVICAPPGMGKSTLMNGLHNNCPTDHLAVFVSLINHNPFLSQRPNFETILYRFLQIDGEKRDWLQQMKGFFWEKRKLYLFLDGLDEVNNQHLDCLLDFAKRASSKGVKVWLSSRENLREVICESLNTVPVDIKELDKDEQNQYIKLKLASSYKNDEIEKITTSIFNSTDLNNSQNLLGIPLQLHIITEMFLNDHQVYQNLEEQNLFVLTKMYKIFFDGKIRFGSRKLIHKNQEQQLGYLRFVLQGYELPALVACLDDGAYEKLQLDSNLIEDFLHELKTEGDKNGIIKRFNENDEAIFDHQTYAEYFACVWFRKNPKKFALLQDDLFSPNRYENLLLMFDVMLAEENPLHLAIIYQDIDLFENHLEEIDSCDRGGRTVFHLAFSYCQMYKPGVGPRERPCYVKMIERLLPKANTIWKKDRLLDFDCVGYAFHTRSMYPIEQMLKMKLISFDECKQISEKYFDRKSLATHSAQLGYPTLLSELIKEHPEFINQKMSGIYLLELAVRGCSTDVCTSPRTGNLEAAKVLIENGSLSNINDILETACRGHCFDMLEMLIENGSKCTEGNTLLHVLVKKCPDTYKDEIVKIIKKFNIDVNARNDEGATALHYAARSSNPKIVDALIQNGAKLNILDATERSVLHYASESFQQDVIKLLLDTGLDVNKRDRVGAAPLHLASANGYLRCAQALLRHEADSNVTDHEKNNALHYALKSDDQSVQITKLLIDGGVSVNHQNHHGQTPLHLACTQISPGHARMLLERGANIHILDDQGNSALHYAAKTQFDHEEVIRLLISEGLDIDAKNRDGLSPIELAYERRSFKNADILLELGTQFDINAKLEGGKTRLHLACMKKDFTAATQLVQKGADVNILDDENRNALSYCDKTYVRYFINAIISHGSNFNTQYEDGRTLLHISCLHGDTPNVRQLIEKGADPNIADHNGRSPLHAILGSLQKFCNYVTKALRFNFQTEVDHQHESRRSQFGCENCYLRLTNRLTEKSSHRNFADHVKQKVSMVMGSSERIDLFLRHVSYTDIGDRRLYCAGVAARFKIFETIDFLIENGSEIDHVDMLGKTALDYASEWEGEYPEVISLLKTVPRRQ